VGIGFRKRSCASKTERSISRCALSTRSTPTQAVVRWPNQLDLGPSRHGPTS